MAQPPAKVGQGVVLFSWIHLSDIHLGHGTPSFQVEQSLVLNELVRDALRQVWSQRAAKPMAIIVTGDVAFSGGLRKDDEYELAAQWLESLATKFGLAPTDVFCVPGNHDVQRSVDESSPDVAALVADLRSGTYQLDQALANPAQVALLRQRLSNFLTFSSKFGPSASRLESPIYWHHELDCQDGVRLRLVGLNTALLAADDQDRGRLSLGLRQLGELLAEPSAPSRERGLGSPDRVLRVVLSHHPFSDGWLSDQDAVSRWVANHAHVHLSGHVHAANAVATVSAGDTTFIRVAAGAAHAGESEQGASQGYNISAILRDPNGEIQLAVWGRRWLPRDKRFVPDAANARDGLEYSLHRLGVGIRTKRPWKIVGLAAAAATLAAVIAYRLVVKDVEPVPPPVPVLSPVNGFITYLDWAGNPSKVAITCGADRVPHFSIGAATLEQIEYRTLQKDEYSDLWAARLVKATDVDTGYRFDHAPRGDFSVPLGAAWPDRHLNDVIAYSDPTSGQMEAGLALLPDSRCLTFVVRRFQGQSQ